LTRQAKRWQNAIVGGDRGVDASVMAASNSSELTL
jgi:hypothetical protein